MLIRSNFKKNERTNYVFVYEQNRVSFMKLVMYFQTIVATEYKKVKAWSNVIFLSKK